MEEQLLQKYQSKNHKLTNYLWILVSILVVIYLIALESKGIFIAITLTLICALIIQSLLSFANHDTFTIDRYITLILGYFLGFASLALLPLDVSQSMRYLYNDGANKSIQQRSKEQDDILQLWTALYWIIFVLKTFIFKLQFIYHNTGYLYTASKIKNTLISYLKEIVVLILILVIVMAIIAGVFKENGGNLITATLQILLNIYGITILVLLLGYGLAQVPYSLWTMSNRSEQLENLLVKAANTYQQQRDSQLEFQDAVQSLTTLINKIPKGHEFYPFVDQLRNELPKNVQGGKSKIGLPIIHFSDLASLKNINETHIATERMNFFQKKFDLERYDLAWKRHCDEVFKICKKETLDQFKGGEFVIELEPLSLVQIIVYRILAVVLGIISMLFIYQETFLIFGDVEDTLIFYMIGKRIAQNGSELGLSFFICLCQFYMVFCSYFAIFGINMLNIFALTADETDAQTMIRNSSLVMMLANPLGYNLMLMFAQINTQQSIANSSFSEFFKPMSKIPVFGKEYNRIVPFLIAIIALASIFKGIGRIIQYLTKNTIKIQVDEKNKDQMVQGQKLVQQEFGRRKHKEKKNATSYQQNKKDYSSFEFKPRNKSEKFVGQEVNLDSSVSKIIDEPFSDTLEIDGMLGFKKCFLEIKQNQLIQYEKEGGKLIEKFDLSQLISVNTKDLKFVLEFNSKKTYRASSQNQLDKWVAELKSHIRKTQSNNAL